VETASKISVVVPCFNGARYVAATLDSALAQEGVAMEIVVVDDGSTDETPAILAGYSDRVRVVTQPNAGMSSARNLGTLHARGEFLMFLDADDLLFPQALARLARALDDSGLGVAYGEAVAMDSDGKPISGGPMGYRSPGENTMRALCAGTLFQPGAGMVRRDLFEKVGGFDTSLISAEDLDFQYRCAAHTEFVKIADAILYYRINPTSMTRNYPRMIERSLEVHATNARRFGLWRAYPRESLAGRVKAGFYFCSEHLGSRGRRTPELSSAARASIRRHPWLLGLFATMPILRVAKGAIRAARVAR